MSTNNDKPPARIYLQWVGDEDTGIGHNRPEGATWSGDKVFPDDVCYIRAGRATAELVEELNEWKRRAEIAEKTLANAIVITVPDIPR